MLHRTNDTKIEVWILGGAFMRRFFALLIVALLLSEVLICPVVAEEQPMFSLEALDQFCNIWNDYHNRYQMNLYVGYNIGDDGSTLSGLCITYNVDHKEVSYGTDIIPPDASLFFIFEPAQSIYGFCVFSDHMKSDLEKAVIYADDMVISDMFTGSSHEESRDMWSISLTGEELLDLYSKNEFTLRLTVDGKSEIIDISHDKQEYLYDMVTFLIRGQLYSNTSSEKYLSSELLPGGIRSTVTAIPAPTEAPYSFREDYDTIDQTAKSLFYVETYDKKDECLASASGFVTFDEHLFVTNQHVIDGAAYLKVWDDDNNMFVVDKVVASDANKDIAILLFPEGKKYNSLEQNADEELKRGQPVVTIGSPKGFQNSVAFGNISAFPEENGIRYIQFTAPISHGSSGGCLFDDSGKVIGITTAGMEEGQNLNFAVPVKLAQDVYDQWNKTDYEPLGSARSWDMVGVTPTPSPSPTPSPTPIPTPTPTPSPKPTPAPTQFYETMEPGSSGYPVKEVLNLLKPLGIKVKMPTDEDTYKEEYLPAVQELEKHFGFNVDGKITHDEYLVLKNALYPGCIEGKVKRMFKKLADLSYISKLPADLKKYDPKYVNAVKKAEEDLGLLVDGIITTAEFEIIMDQEVEMPAMPVDLKAVVKDDTVTLTWSKVPDAVEYEVFSADANWVYGTTDNLTMIGTTAKPSYIVKSITTGKEYMFIVQAKKYTVTGKPAVVKVDVPLYYRKVTIAELNKNFSQYAGRTVEIKDAKYFDYTVISPEGKSVNRSSRPIDSEGYKLYIICKDSKGMVALCLSDLNAWTRDFISMCNNGSIKMLAGKGMVLYDTYNWSKDHDVYGEIKTLAQWSYESIVPIIELDNISWK